MTRGVFLTDVDGEDIDLPATVATKAVPQTGGQFVLQQNYPNPFGKGNTINFSLLQRSRAWLDIYDNKGWNVARLIEGTLEAGYHSIDWDGYSGGVPLPAGSYAYQLNVENSAGIYRQVKMMTI